jgi:hypothetical protein
MAEDGQLSERVAVLYVDPRGPYMGRGDVDAWDAARDARQYDGPLPVVAHPPCGPWGGLRHLYKGTEHDCAPRAVEQVRRFGGVLEHPAQSRLWAHCQLPRPDELPDAWGGVTIEVDQVRWGHVARKRTWLYLVGLRDVGAMPPPREPTHWISGFRSAGGRKYPARYKRNGCAVPPGIKVCSAEQRRRTPAAFAEWLIALAKSARMER